MRRYVKARMAAACMALLSFCMCLTGCGNDSVSDKLQIVCTIFPEYDWVRRIVGDIEDVNVSLLVKDGTDLHSYQPSVRDIAQIAQADLFCYVGGTSDDWVTDVLETAGNDSVTVVSMLEAADAAEEMIVAGMQEEEHHHHNHAESEEHAHEAAELDEHVWLSLRRAQLGCLAICDALCELDEAHAEAYRTNCDAYLAELQELDARYTELFAQQTVRDTILVADRFPFRYLAEDYGLTYYAAFPGCSSETGASFETIVFLAEQVRQKQLPCVIVTENSDNALANTILESAESKGEILTMYAMQSVTKQQLREGISYLGQMEQNLKTLLKALSY